MSGILIEDPARPVQTTGPAPFNQPTADITLRTQDHVDFHVHTHILAQASPVFAGMFTLPQPPSDAHSAAAHHRPIVDVAEDSKTLERLLCLCYPINKQRLGELDDIVPVLIAATKYEMEWPVSLLTNDLLAVAPLRPLKVWAVACQTGLEGLAHRAACAMRERAASATQCLCVLEALLKEEGLSSLDGIYAGDYYRLREFLRLTATDMSSKLLVRSSWPPPSTYLSGFLSTFQLPSASSTTASSNPPSSSSSSTRRSRKKSRMFSAPAIPAPDVVLKCPDGSTLRAHHLILSLHFAPLGAKLDAARAEADVDVASPTGSPPGAQPGPSSLHAIDLDLDAYTLGLLLGCLYEGEGLLPPSLSDLAALLLAAQKYEMVRLVRMIERRWEEKAAQSPLEAYFIAVQHSFKDYARAAARNVLRKPLARWYELCMESSSALAYHRLLVYFDACARVVEDQLEKAALDWQSGTVHKMPGYDSSYNDSYPDDQTWFPDYLRTLKDKAKDGPARKWEVTTHQLVTEVCTVSAAGSFWPYSVHSQCQTLGEGLLKASSLPNLIKDAIGQVELEL